MAEKTFWTEKASMKDFYVTPTHWILTLCTFGLYFIIIYLTRLYTRYTLTNERLIIESGILSKNLDEINNLNSLIKKSLLEIEGLRLEKNKLGSVVMNLESEIGPLKYFVGLVKDLGIAQIGPDQAVRIIILIIVCVFDLLTFGV